MAHVEYDGAVCIKLLYFDKLNTLHLLDPLNEDLYRQSLRAYAALGDRSSVTRTYTTLQKVLFEELNASPMQETISLYQNLINKD